MLDWMLVAAALIAAQPATEDDTSSTDHLIHTDGMMLPDRNEISHNLICGGVRISLAYSQTRRRRGEDEADAGVLFAVAFDRLNFSDRVLSAAAVDRIRALFRTYAWIDRLETRCDHRYINLDVEGMSLRAWADHLGQGGPEPPAAAAVIAINPRGEVRIEP